MRPLLEAQVHQINHYIGAHDAIKSSKINISVQSL